MAILSGVHSRMKQPALDSVGPSALANGRSHYIDDLEEPTLSIGEIRSVVRRQLVGSVVVAFGVAAVVGLIALRPVHDDVAGASARNFLAVQQPTFLTPPGRLTAALKHRTELP